jgi:pimeloyl-ACP methyl ester carboxylesterase
VAAETKRACTAGFRDGHETTAGRELGDQQESVMAAAATSGVARADGADLYFERRGDGPPLLLIAGGGGDCGYYSAMAGILGATYTVMTYDRRGNSRSPLHQAPAKISLAEQTADAVVVLQACGLESTRIFGNSGGATIALDLAAHHPQIVEAVVAHEPPVPRVLPDADDNLAVYDEIDRVLEKEGWRAAFRLFQDRIGHVPPGQLPATMTALLDPAGDFRHDPFHRPRVVIAGRLGVEFAEFPGGHLAPAEVPGPFATRLHELFGRLQA